MGKTGGHVSLVLERGRVKFRAVWFGVREEEFPFFIGENIDIAANIDKNEFRGEIHPSVMIRAAKLSGIDDDELFRGFSVYKKVKYSKEIPDKIKETACPDRKTAADVFRFVKKEPPASEARRRSRFVSVFLRSTCAEFISRSTLLSRRAL